MVVFFAGHINSHKKVQFDINAKLGKQSYQVRLKFDKFTENISFSIVLFFVGRYQLKNNNLS